MSTALRLGLLYGLMFSAVGTAMPFFPVLFAQHGLSGAEIGLVLAAPMLARMITGPAIAVWADRFQRRRTPTAILLLVGAGGMAATAFAHDVWTFLLAAMVWGAAQPGAVPLIDIMTLRRARREGFDYGWPRGLGSLGYIAANVAWGALLIPVGAGVVPWSAAAGLLVAAAVALWLVPAEPTHDEPQPLAPKFEGWDALKGNRPYLLAIAAAACAQASHGFYYGFSTLVWTGSGIPASLVGLMWGLGVGVEVAFLWFAGGWRARLGPVWLLRLGCGAAMLRWAALAFEPPLWALLPLQTLHALTFAATFLGSLQLIERLTPARHASLAQAVSAALTSTAMGVATLTAGPLFDAVGAWGYLLMAGLATLGLALAIAVPATPGVEVQPQSSGVGGSTTEPM